MQGSAGVLVPRDTNGAGKKGSRGSWRGRSTGSRGSWGGKGTGRRGG